MYRRWEQLNDDPAEDGPSGWFAAMFTFKALAGEVTGKTRLRTTATYITDAAGQLPEIDAPPIVGLVQIDPDEEAEEDSPRGQMLLKFGQVVELVAERVQRGLLCDPGEIRSAVFG